MARIREVMDGTSLLRSGSGNREGKAGAGGAGGRSPLWGRRLRSRKRTAGGRARAHRAARLRAQPAGGLLGRGGAQVGWLAVGGGCPSSPPLSSRGPGHALGWRRAGESGRVFPPPLGQRASATERVPPSSIRLRRPPAARVFPTSAAQPLPPGFSLGWTGALEGGFKSARGSCSARGVWKGASMVSGVRRGPGLDSGGGAGGEGSLSLRPWPSRSPSPAKVSV